MAFGRSLLNAINSVSLVKQIAVGLVLGIVIGSVSPQLGLAAGLFGSCLSVRLKPLPLFWFLFWSQQPLRSIKKAMRRLSSLLSFYI